MRKDKLRSRTCILEAAEEAFAKQGVDAVHFDEIGVLAGVSRGTLYNHFKNKDDLIQQLAIPVLEEGIKLFSEPEITSLEAIASQLVKLWKRHGSALAIVNCSKAGQLVEVRKKHTQFVREYQKAFNIIHAKRPLPSGVHQSMILSFTSYIPIFTALGRGDHPITEKEYAKLLESILYWRIN